jgi:hypothetical protein
MLSVVRLLRPESRNRLDGDRLQLLLGSIPSLPTTGRFNGKISVVASSSNRDIRARLFSGGGYSYFCGSLIGKAAAPEPKIAGSSPARRHKTL